MSEFRFPKVVVREIKEEDGRTFMESLTSPVCDFCFDERATWSYESEDFQLDTNAGPWASHDGWAVCDICSNLVEQEGWPYLVARVIASWRALGRKIGSEQVIDASAIVHGFADHYTPGRTAFG